MTFIPYFLGGVGAVAVGLTIADFFGRRRPRRYIDGRAIDIDKSRIGPNNLPYGNSPGEYFPPPDDGRPQK